MGNENEYERALRLAELAIAAKWAAHEPLPRTAFFAGKRTGTVSRPTEYAACVLATWGFIPGAIYNPAFWAPPYRPVIKHWDWVLSEPEPKGTAKESRRECVECGQIKPLSADFWHRDPKGRLGWQTKCKACRNADEKRRYKDRKAA